MQVHTQLHCVKMQDRGVPELPLRLLQSAGLLCPRLPTICSPVQGWPAMNALLAVQAWPLHIHFRA